MASNDKSLARALQRRNRTKLTRDEVAVLRQVLLAWDQVLTQTEIILLGLLQRQQERRSGQMELSRPRFIFTDDSSGPQAMGPDVVDHEIPRSIQYHVHYDDESEGELLIELDSMGMPSPIHKNQTGSVSKVALESQEAAPLSITGASASMVCSSNSSYFSLPTCNNSHEAFRAAAGQESNIHQILERCPAVPSDDESYHADLPSPSAPRIEELTSDDGEGAEEQKHHDEGLSVEALAPPNGHVTDPESRRCSMHRNASISELEADDSDDDPTRSLLIRNGRLSGDELRKYVRTTDALIEKLSRLRTQVCGAFLTSPKKAESDEFIAAADQMRFIVDKCVQFNIITYSTDT